MSLPSSSNLPLQTRYYHQAFISPYHSVHLRGGDDCSVLSSKTSVLSKGLDPRSGALRYLGYANEVTEATKSVVSSRLPLWNPIGWGIVTAYTLGDAWIQTKNTLAENKGTNSSAKKRLILASVMDSLVFQALASAFGPVVIIYGVKHAVKEWLGQMSRSLRLPPSAAKQIPHVAVGLGLLSIAGIPKLIDAPAMALKNWILKPLFHWAGYQPHDKNH